MGDIEGAGAANTMPLRAASLGFGPFKRMLNEEGREMGMQSNGGAYESDSVIPLARAAKSAPYDADQLDTAGQTILKLLHKAADVAEANSQHALEMAQKLSHQLRAAEDRIAELEAEVQLYHEKADRAEQWLHKVYTEIEERFIRQPEDKRRALFGPAGRRAV
jgi:hypothetical protein